MLNVEFYSNNRDSQKQDVSPILQGSYTSEFFDSRGILYQEYIPRKRMDVIPHINTQGIEQVISFFEKNAVPKNLEKALQQIDIMLQQHMKYDAMNYLLGQNIDKRPESYTANIDPEKIGLTQKQFSAFRQQITQYKKIYPEVAEIPDLEKQMETLEGITRLLKGPDGMFLSKLLSTDLKYIGAHHQGYNDSIVKILKEGVGQCHTFSTIAKLILEAGNTRWKLGIRKITYLSSPSGDHTLLEILGRNGEKIIYDPTSGFTLKERPVETTLPSQKKSH